VSLLTKDAGATRLRKNPNDFNDLQTYHSFISLLFGECSGLAIFATQNIDLLTPVIK
jgi:hypothetical protein